VGRGGKWRSGGEGNAEWKWGELEEERSAHLVRSVRDADVKVRQIGLDEIAEDDLELLLLGSGVSATQRHT
jgi:hypothetical protein